MYDLGWSQIITSQSFDALIASLSPAELAPAFSLGIESAGRLNHSFDQELLAQTKLSDLGIYDYL